MGFAKGTTGGKAGEIYVVTDSSDDTSDPKPGTLRYGVIQKEPLWIIFAKSMTIRLHQELIVQSDKTIDGRGVNVHIANGAGIYRARNQIFYFKIKNKKLKSYIMFMSGQVSCSST